MKVKIGEVGYQNFNGSVGLVEFKDGVSVNDISSSELTRLSAVYVLLDAETDKQIGLLTDFNKNINTAFPIEGKQADEGVALVNVGDTIPLTVAKEIYTREQLEALADKNGIAGLREVAKEFNVKNTSITGLITEILDAQALRK